MLFSIFLVLAEGMLAEGMLAEGMLAEGMLAEGMLAEGMLAEGMLAEGILRGINHIEEPIFITSFFIKAFTCAIAGTYLIIYH